MNQLKSKAFLIIIFLSISFFSMFGQELCYAAVPSFSSEPTCTVSPSFSPTPTSTVIPSFSPIPTSTTVPSFSPTPTSSVIPSFSPKPSISPTYVPTAIPTILPAPCAVNSEYKLIFPGNSWTMGDNPFPNEEPSIVQNPPSATTPPQISSENSIPDSTNIPSLQEEVTESYTKISGVRLQYLLEIYPDYIPFEHNGILLQLPSRFLQNLNMSSEDSLWVELIKTDLYSFTLSIRLNNVDLVEFSEAKIQLPVNNIKNYTLYYNNEKTEIPIRYENKIARFTIYKTGAYSLKTSEEDTVPLTASFTNISDYKSPKIKVIAIPSIVGIIIISCLYILIKRKRSHNEKANLT